MNHHLLTAIKFTRHSQWQLAFEQFHSICNYNLTSRERSIALLGARLCKLNMSKTENDCKQITRQRLEQIRQYKSLEEYLVIPIELNHIEPGHAYRGEVYQNTKGLNQNIILDFFLCSPWQCSIGFITMRIIRDAIGADTIKFEATKAFARKKLNVASILYAYLSPLGPPLLRLNPALSNLNTKYSSLNFEVFDYFHQHDHDLRDHLNISEVEEFLRNALSIIPRHLISAKTINNNLNQSNANENEIHDIFAGSIFLNESKYLLKCLFNHYPLIDRWCLVEGTCKGYPERKVTPEGLSKDSCWLSLELFPDSHQKITYINHGWTKSKGEDAKSELRNQYIKRCSGSSLVVIDIDEFYTPYAFKQAVNKILEGYSGVVVPQIHFWKNTDKFIIGGYYDVSHMRFFAVTPGFRYVSNHNFPDSSDGIRLDKIRRFKFDRVISKRDTSPTWLGTYCFHMGFAKDDDDMKDKTEYYVNRGEHETRPVTTQSRAAWFTGQVPQECQIMRYTQPLPLVLST
jgi:hypothetical protein